MAAAVYAQDPSLFEAPYTYARLLNLRGDPVRAADYFEIAANLDHDDYQAMTLASGIYRGLGKIEDAKRASLRAIDAMERALTSDPGDARALYLGAGMLDFLGRPEEANQWALRAEQIAPNDTPTLYNLACFHAVAGRGEKAIDILEKAADLGWNRSEWASRDSDLDSIRTNPRFVALLERLRASVVAAHTTARRSDEHPSQQTVATR